MSENDTPAGSAPKSGSEAAAPETAAAAPEAAAPEAAAPEAAEVSAPESAAAAPGSAAPARENSRWRRRVWWLIPAAVLLATVVSGVRRARVPTRADWSEASQIVRAELKPGDGVAWTPYWAGEGRLFMHGLPAFHLPSVQAADLSRYERVWLMGAFGYDADRLPPGHRLVRRQRVGRLTLDLVEVGGERMLGELLADLEMAEVTRQAPGQSPQRCDFWDGRGWHCELRDTPQKTRACLGRPIARRLADRRRDPHCGLNPFLNVSRDVRVIGDAPRRCVWLHPIAGRTVAVRWPGAPAGDWAVVELGFADQMIDDHPRKDGTRVKPARVRLLREEPGGEVALGEHGVAAEKGWGRWRVALPPGRAPLRLEVETESTVDAHLCVDLTVRAGGTP